MIADLLVWTVLVPLLMGLGLGFLSRMRGAGRVLVGGLLFLAAVLAVMVIEGLPVFPPVAGKQKLPFALAGLAVFFLGLGLIRPRLGRLASAALVLAATALPAIWIGYRLLVAAPEKAFVLVALLVAVSLITVPLARPAATPAAGGSSPLIGLLFVLIATSVVSVTGGYIGMAQVAGALAAVTGGWLLVGYVAYLRGDDAALHPGALPLLAWLVLSGLFLVLTLLFAPSVNRLALGFAALPLAVAAWLAPGTGLPAGLLRALRPVIAGLLCALPALAAILLAVSA